MNAAIICWIVCAQMAVLILEFHGLPSVVECLWRNCGGFLLHGGWSMVIVVVLGLYDIL